LLRPSPGRIERFSSSPDNAVEGVKVEQPRATDQNGGSAGSRKGSPRSVKPVRSPTTDSLKSRPARGQRSGKSGSPAPLTRHEGSRVAVGVQTEKLRDTFSLPALSNSVPSSPVPGSRALRHNLPSSTASIATSLEMERLREQHASLQRELKEKNEFVKSMQEQMQRMFAIAFSQGNAEGSDMSLSSAPSSWSPLPGTEEIANHSPTSSAPIKLAGVGLGEKETREDSKRVVTADNPPRRRKCEVGAGPVRRHAADSVASPVLRHRGTLVEQAPHVQVSPQSSPKLPYRVVGDVGQNASTRVAGQGASHGRSAVWQTRAASPCMVPGAAVSNPPSVQSSPRMPVWRRT